MTGMNQQQEPRRFGCKQCGHPFETYPPDDEHLIMRLDECPEGDSIEIIHNCENCHTDFRYYWDHRHDGPVVVSASFPTTLEEIEGSRHRSVFLKTGGIE